MLRQYLVGNVEDCAGVCGGQGNGGTVQVAAAEVGVLGSCEVESVRLKRSCGPMCFWL
jgi:hypothetical protein